MQVLSVLFGRHMTITTRRCIGCGKSHTVEVSEEGYFKWKAGAFVQDAFPELTPDEREMLISGTCKPCWEELFKNSSEEE